MSIFRLFHRSISVFLISFLFSTTLFASDSLKEILPGAWQIEQYLPALQGKKVALLINHTSRVGEISLLDTLLHRKIHIVKIFVPEHGFRGAADAGAHIENNRDARTGIPIISLYGQHKKPREEDLSDVDIVIYDLQDVGVRFYTYISTLEYMLSACARQNIEVMILDRPNPNGFYVDGPVLNPEQKSFVGMQSVPIVYGMTPAEYAQMLCGEKWIQNAERLSLTIIPCRYYDHNRKYILPVPPSPNLKNMAAVYLYPSLCLFEGTAVSVGRGTKQPFQQFGHPDFLKKADDYFVPRSMPGAKHPKYEGKKCYGKHLAETPEEALELIKNQLQLDWLLTAYDWFPDNSSFFNDFFENLAGTEVLKRQIQSGKSERDIRSSWQSDLEKFKKIRKKYLLYPDFE